LGASSMKRSARLGCSWHPTLLHLCAA
jgi:hypothetical protein